MDFKPKNREWVKNAAIIFLAVLLVLTFFSNTIMNRTLAEAATSYVTSGTITAKVRGTGKVVANGTNEVKADQTRQIRSVMVKAGQEVNAGDVLFILGAGDSEELETAKETLRELQYSYQKSAVSMPTYDYSSYQKAIDEAEAKAEPLNEAADKAYNNYIAKLNAAGVTEANLTKYQQELETAKSYLTTAQTELTSAKADYNTRYQAALDRVTAAQQKLNALTGTSSSSGTDETAGEATGESTPTPSTTTQATQSEIDAAKKELSDAQTALSQMKEETDPYVVLAQTAYNQAYEDYKTAAAKVDANIPYSVIQYKEAYDAAEEAYEAAAKEVEYAYNALYAAQATNNTSSAVSSIELQQLAEKIQLQQDKIKELSGEDGTEITANVSGTVESVSCTAGDTVAKDTVLCTIEVPDMGYTLSFSVTNDQAQRLRIGDTATVSNYYWGSEIVATLSSMRNDPKNPQSNKQLTFDLEGDVTSGSELTISVGSKSASYDLIVPNSAIRSDTNGSFVLAITAKNSPLGNRYIAKRVSVEVIASDDENSAVTGGLNNGDYVITTTSAPVSDGDMVRLADSSAS